MINKFTKSKKLLIIISFIFILLSMRFGWFLYFNAPTNQTAERGVVDLRHITLKEDKVIFFKWRMAILSFKVYNWRF